MNTRINEILAPARAIVNPPIPTHADIPVFPPDAKSVRTYYLWENGRVCQRKDGPGGWRVLDTARATTTMEAVAILRHRHTDLDVF